MMFNLMLVVLMVMATGALIGFLLAFGISTLHYLMERKRL